MNSIDIMLLPTPDWFYSPSFCPIFVMERLISFVLMIKRIKLNAIATSGTCLHLVVATAFCFLVPSKLVLNWTFWICNYKVIASVDAEHKLPIGFTWLTSSCLKVFCGGECIKNSLRSCVSITNNWKMMDPASNLHIKDLFVMAGEGLKLDNS